MLVTLETGISAITVFLQGLLSFFSPCTLPLVPLYISYLAGGGKKIDAEGKIYYPKKRVLINTIGFVLGISAAFFLLGLGFSVLGQFFNEYKNWFSIASGIIMILFGLYQFGILGKVKAVENERRIQINLEKWTMNPVTAWVLGFTFSFAWTPCIGPVLSSVLLMASSAQTKAGGFLLIGVYTVGFIIPFLIVGLFTGTVLDLFKKYQKVVKYTVKIGAVLLIVMGIMTMTGFINGISSYFSSISSDNSEEIKTTASPVPETSKEPETAAEQEQQVIPAPDFVLEDQFGMTHTLSQYKGKIVFINFWTTWCGYCKEEMPDIQKIYEQNGNNANDLIILGAANPKSSQYPSNQDVEQSEIEQFLQDGGYSFPVVMDTTGELFGNYGIMSFPTTIIVGKDGNVLGYIPAALSYENMQDIIEQARNLSK